MIFNLVKQKTIAICIVDVSSLCQSDWARTVAANLGDYLISYFYKKEYDIYIGYSEDILLQEVSDSGFYTHAVVLASGTALSMNYGLELTRDIEAMCKKEFALAGHILDRGESYYELHHQFYIVNIKHYEAAEKPMIGYWEEGTHTQVKPIRSEDNVHDDYVPLWIKQGTSVTQYNKKLHGWNIISTMLARDMTIIDIGVELRNRKQYLYYEYDTVFLKHIPKLHQHAFLANNFIFPLNTDGDTTRLEYLSSLSEPIEQLVTIATGFNWIKDLTVAGFTPSTEVIFADINIHALNFMRKFVTEFDGDDYGKLYRESVEQMTVMLLPFSDTIIEDLANAAQTQWSAFKQQFVDWYSVWADIKQLRYQFRPIDYTADYNLDWMDSNKRTVYNVSDIFGFAPVAFKKSVKYKIACENRLLETLASRNPNSIIIFTAKAADGFRTSPSTRLIGPVTDIALTNINELKAPDWHRSDWTSAVILR
jgi:hypothetical protein